MNVAVLGAGGYLGSEVVRRARISSEEEVLEFRDAAAFGASDRNRAVGALINCVGYYGDDGDRLQEANRDHAERAARLAAASGATFVHISSSAVFDASSSGLLTEDRLPVPATRYGRSKFEGELAVQALLPDARIARPAKVFGGADPRHRLHALALHIRRRRPLPMPRGGRLWANFVSVGSAAQVIVELALADSAPPVTHLSSSMPWPDFVEELASALETTPRPLPSPLEAPFALLARGLWRLPEPRPRLAARVLELWDETEFADTQSLIPKSALIGDLEDLAGRLR